ncbi:MAG: hypothetical protein ACR2PV_06045 [Gammaproteobacteria bacterium]
MNSTDNYSYVANWRYCRRAYAAAVLTHPFLAITGKIATSFFLSGC